MRKLAACLFCAALVVSAADWPTFGGDPQRTGWARGEKAFTTANVGGLRLEWKTALENTPRELTALTAPVVMGTAVIVAGSADRLFAVDPENGRLRWQARFDAQGAPKQQPDWLCPSGLNATPVIDPATGTVYAIASDGRVHALDVENGEERFAPAPFVPPFSKNWSLNFAGGVLYTTTSQGCNGAPSGVWAMDVRDLRRTVRHFFSTTTGGAGVWGRAGAAVSDAGVVWAETGDGPYDPAAGKYADTFLALSAKDLRLVDFYTPQNRDWITKKDLDMGCISPVVFPFRRLELVAGGGKEGVLFLLDAKSPGGAGHRTPLYRSPQYLNAHAELAARGFWGALTTWADAGGARWLCAPAWGPQAPGSPRFPATDGETPDGSIMAFRLEEADGKPALAPAWRSRNLAVPEPAVVSNGVVFALSNGENVSQVMAGGGRVLTTAERIAGVKEHAVLYAFDAATGRQLYSSGDAISGWTHFSGLAVADGRAFVVTHESVLYAFGLHKPASGETR